MPRPPLPDDQRLDAMLRVRLRTAELAELQRAVPEGELSAWVRELALRAARKRRARRTARRRAP